MIKYSFFVKVRKMNTQFIKLRDILFTDWDPIMVNNNMKLKDEYESYVYKILAFDKNKRTKEEIFNFLKKIEDYDIGVGTSDEVKLLVSEKIMKIIFS